MLVMFIKIKTQPYKYTLDSRITYFNYIVVEIHIRKNKVN